MIETDFQPLSFREMLKPFVLQLDKNPTFEAKAYCREEYDSDWDFEPPFFDPSCWGGPYFPDALRCLPKFSGIYLIVTGRSNLNVLGKVQYVGQAKSVQGRLRSHATLKLICQFFDDVEIFVQHCELERLCRYEKLLIEHYDPPINFIHRIKESIRGAH